MEKTIFVTGASKGIGRAICHYFAEKKFIVGALARNEKLLEELKSTNARIATYCCDVTDAAAVELSVKNFIAKYGAIDVLVNNVGFADHKPFTQYSIEDWKRHVDVNLHGTFLPIHFSLPSMLDLKKGHIVNICSISGKLAHVNGSAYCAAKHAVHGLSRALLAEVRGKGVRVTTIYPGSTLTEMFSQNVNIANPEVLLKPQDIAEAVWYAVTSPSRVMVEELSVTPRGSVVVNTIR